MTSRDVIFDEENTWDWEQKQPDGGLLDDESEKQPVPAASVLENSSDLTPKAAEIIPTAEEINDAAKQPLRRTRKRPAWLADYEVDENNDSITHFALFSNNDPKSYESAVKDENGKRRWMMK